MPEPRQRYYNNNGQVAGGCLLYTYAAGTSTPKATYTDSAGTTPHANPIVLDSKGEAAIYWSGAYKVDLKTAAGVQITGYPVDNYVASTYLADTLRTDLAASAGAGLIGGGDQIVASIAALRALLKTSASKNAFVLGYYVASDGGGGPYWYDSTDTTTADNGGTVIVATDGGRWKLSHNWRVSVKQFGAKPDGTTVADTALQNALTAAVADGFTLAFGGPPDAYKLTTGLILTGAIEIDGGGAALNISTMVAASTSADGALSATGTAAATIALTSDVLAGATTIDLASITGLVVEDWVYLRSEKAWATVGGTVTYGEWVRVKSIVATSITTFTPVLYGYATADTSTIERVTFISNITIRDLNVTGAGDAASYHNAFRFTKCFNVVLENCGSDKCDYASAIFSHCLGFSVMGHRPKRANLAGLSYGIAILNGSSFGIIDGIIGDDLRHTATIGGTSGVNRWITINNLTALRSRDAGADCHPAGDRITFSNLQIECANSGADAVTMQGINFTVENVTLSNTARHGVLAQPLSVEPSSGTVRAVKGVAAQALVFYQASDGDVVSATIDDVQGVGSTYLVLLQADAGKTVKRYSITNSKSTAALVSRGIRVFATGASAVIRRGTISGNVIEIAVGGLEAIYLHGSTGVVEYSAVNGNHTDAGTYGLRGVGTDYITTDGSNGLLNATTSNRTVAGNSNRLGNDIGTPTLAEIQQQVTIATGAVTLTGSMVKQLSLDTEAAAASDDLDTITATGAYIGQVIQLKSTADARDVVCKDSTGNMRLSGDRTLSSLQDRLTLFWDGSFWYELSFADNAA